MSSISAQRLFPAGGDPEGPPPGWLVTLPDGRELRWEGFYTGPVELTRGELHDAARRLLGLNLEQVPAAAAAVIVPAAHDDGAGPGIVLHSATPVLRSLQGDIDYISAGQEPDDVATYVETRSVSLARPGDLVVGRTHPWREAARLAGVETVVIPGIDYFYLSHALVRTLVDGGGPAIDRLVQALRDRPQTVLRLYSLDLELQIALLYLHRAAGVPRLYVDANSPEVASYWNTKAPLYPRVEEAVRITGADPDELMRAETELTAMRSRLGLTFQRLPGYIVDARGRTEAEVADRLLLAARLLRERYGLTEGCLKPSEGGGGARIHPGIDLADEAGLRDWAAVVWPTGELFVLEAQVDYRSVTMGGRQIRLAPSAHIRYGRLADGLTLQVTAGTAWQGNVFVDRAAAPSTGITTDQYDEILSTVERLRAALVARGQDLITGGVDFAIGRIGGYFGDRVVVAVQDPNLSSHGAEYLRRYLDEIRSTGGPRYAATKVICPTAAGSLRTLRAIEHFGTTGDTRFQVISAIPGRWGMIAAGARSPRAAVEEVLAFEKDLVGRGLTHEVPPRE